MCVIVSRSLYPSQKSTQDIEERETSCMSERTDDGEDGVSHFPTSQRDESVWNSTSVLMKTIVNLQYSF